MSIFLKNGDYVIQNGVASSGDQLLMLVYTRLRTASGTYIFNKTFGNRLINEVNKPVSNLSREFILKALTDALADLMTLGLVKTITVKINSLYEKGVTVSATIEILKADNTIIRLDEQF